MVSKTWPILDETLDDMIENERFPGCCFKMVDFGCASGPNTLLVISHIMDTFQDLSARFQEIQIFLNDLPGDRTKWHERTGIFLLLVSMEKYQLKFWTSPCR